MNNNVHQLRINLTSAKESLQRNGGGGDRVNAHWIDEQITLLRLIEEDYTTARETFTETKMVSFDAALAGVLARHDYIKQVQAMLFNAIREEPMDQQKVDGFMNLHTELKLKYQHDCESLVTRYNEHLNVTPIPLFKRDQQ